MLYRIHRIASFASFALVALATSSGCGDGDDEFCAGCDCGSKGVPVTCEIVAIEQTSPSASCPGVIGISLECAADGDVEDSIGTERPAQGYVFSESCMTALGITVGATVAGTRTEGTGSCGYVDEPSIRVAVRPCEESCS